MKKGNSATPQAEGGKRGRASKWVKPLAVVASMGCCVVLGVRYLPSLITKVSNNLYKSSRNKTEIDIENLGPEIVRKNNCKEEE